MNPARRGLLCAIGASAALHLVVLAARAPGSALSAAEPHAAVLLTRLIAAPERNLPAASPASPEGPDATSAAVEAPLSAPAVVATPVPQADAARDAAVPAPAAPQPALVTSPPAVAATRPPLNDVPEAAAPAGYTEPKGLAGDRGPQLLDDIDATLPASAGIRGGSVTVRLLISDRGAIEKVTILRSSPPGLLDEAALAALAKVRFAPGLRGGLPVRSEVVYDIDFASLGRGTDASGRTY